MDALQRHLVSAQIHVSFKKVIYSSIKWSVLAHFLTPNFTPKILTHKILTPNFTPRILTHKILIPNAHTLK